MTRPLRLEFAGALYHITSRGDRMEEIYRNEADRRAWLEILRLVCARFNFIVHAYCQMTNHYHLLLETVDGNLQLGMRQLNGVYSQGFNRRHGLVGHIFQGRYKAILVQKESHLLELARYIVLNPLRAGMVVAPDDWPWSSHHVLLGEKPAPCWLHTDGLLGRFGACRGQAMQAYRRFVMQGMGLDSPLSNTRHQLMLGDAAFVARHQQEGGPESFCEISRAQRRSLALSIDEYRTKYACRDEAMARAYLSTAFTMAHIARHFGVSYKTVSRAVKNFESGSHEPG